MGDYFIFEADKEPTQYYLEKWHLYLAEVGVQINRRTNHRAMLDHLRERPRYEAFVLIDTHGRASHYEIERKPVLIGTTTLKANDKGVWLPTKEEYWGPPLPRLSKTSKTMGEA